jgi:hypothetical protein
MAVFLHHHIVMKKKYILSLLNLFTALLLVVCPATMLSQVVNKEQKIQSILYFNPEVFPDVEEIKEPTYSAFYSAVSERNALYRNFKMLRVDTNLSYEEPDTVLIEEFCENNNAQFVVVSKVTYFKVGIGKYVFSNQVLVSVKLFDAAGNFLAETDYDTYKKNKRILGSAENSIKIGTTGAMKNMEKTLRDLKKTNLFLEV